MEQYVSWSIPVPKKLDEALELAIREKVYITKSDFVRDSVRRRLEQLEYLH